MLASNRDEWANRLSEEWNEELNLAKNNAPSDEMCKIIFCKRKTNNLIFFFLSCKIRKSTSCKSYSFI
jgi:hypothetical protein